MTHVQRVTVIFCLSASFGSSQTPASSVTMRIESIDHAYQVGDTVVINVRVTNSSKQDVTFVESPQLGWSIVLYKADDKTHTDLLAEKRRKNLAAHTETSNDGMAASLDVKPGESLVFRTGLETADLALQPGPYIIVVRRLDLRSKVELASQPFALVLGRRPPS